MCADLKFWTWRVVLLIVAYHIIPLVLIGAWIMVDFFEFFSVGWNDVTWRSYAATTGGWIIMEVPLIAILAIRAVMLYRARHRRG